MESRRVRGYISRMNTRRLIALGTLAVFLASMAAAQATVGVVSYIEGGVDVSRNGEFLDPDLIEIGLTIEEFDTVETGPNGYVEVEMTAPSAGSLVKVRPDTAFYFEGTPRESSRFRTTFQLLRGSLALKVGKLTSGESFGVQTDTAVMAVRGTEFNVDMAPDRSVLVSVPEGRVESQTDTRTVMAQPGTVAAIDERASMSAVAVEAEDIDLYREYWRGLRLEALKINARLSIQQYARQWDQQLPRLENAMRELGSHDEIFRRWIRVARGQADPPATGQAVRDKRALSRGMLELRAVLPVAERTFQTLVGLEEAYRDGYAEGPFMAGSYRNAAAFYRSFQADKAKMRRMLSAARWMIRIYRVIDRQAGGFPDSGGSGLMSTLPAL